MKSKVTKALPFVILFLVFALVPLSLNSRSWINIFITIVINMVVAVSMRFILISGNMSFAHGAFMGVGAYTAGMLALYVGLPFWVTIIAGAVLAAVIGIITGWPFARLKNMYFSMGTMFMGQAIVLLISSWDLAGGAIGLNRIPSLTSGALGDLAEALQNAFEGSGAFGFLALSKPQVGYFFILLLAVVAVAVMYRLEYSRVGTTLRALSQSEDVAASIGINPTFYRLLAVGVGCFFAGMMGACQALYLTTLSYYSYAMSTTLWIIMYMMIGGTGNIVGPMLGAVVITLVQNLSSLLTSLSGNATSETFVAFSRWVGTNSAYTPFLTSAVLLVVAYLLPGGLHGIPAAIRSAKAKRAEKKEIAEMLKGGDAE